MADMNNYEGIFIIKPDLNEEAVKNVFKALGELVVKNGALLRRKSHGARERSHTPSKKSKKHIILNWISLLRRLQYRKWKRHIN